MTNKQWFYLLFFTTIILWTIFIIRPFEPGPCRVNRIMTNKSFDGVVKEKILNSKNHETELLISTDNQFFEWSDDSYSRRGRGFFDLIAIGDSVKKLDGSLNILIYHSDTLLNIDLSFPCD